MADTAVAPAGEGAAGDAGAAPAEGGVWGAVKGMAFRMLIIYFASSFLKGFGGGGSGGSQPAPAGAKGAVANAKGYAPARNMFPPGQLFDMYMYLLPHGDRFEQFEGVEPFWTEYGLKYGDWEAGPNKDGSLTFARTIDTPAELQRNQSIWLHVFITKAGHSPNPNERSHLKRETIYDSKQLNKFRKKYYKKTANLLTGESEQSDEDLAKAEVMKYEVLNYWHPNMTISLVDDHTAWTKDALPSPLDQAVKFDPTGMQYKPIFMFNDYWNLVRDMQPVNETVKQLNVSITYAPLSLFKFQLYASQQMQNKWSSMLSGDMFEEPDDDKDSIKEALLETNPVLLGVTAAVSLLHTVFEFLAFKNDIQFWRTKKDLVGLSVRSVLFNLFQSAVVFLYICDNDTNFVVKMSVFVGLLIEGWKIPKVLDVKVDYENKWLGVIPRVSFSDKGSYIESATKEYDQMAFRYLSWALYPLIVGYAIYSLIYHEQRGWYSWVLSMMYGFLLTFGFIVMTPQLFINYKLKSVAHLPWRMLTYKFINTFIDDLFAFVIKMPTMYRLGCFRDDIIFLVYLYQRWAYRVDPTRMNEYGTSMDDPSGAEAIEAEKAKEQEEKGGAGEEKTQHKEESKKDK